MIETMKSLAVVCLLGLAGLVLYAVLTKHPMWGRLSIALILLICCTAFVGVALHLIDYAR
jgi:hypothetical protein